MSFTQRALPFPWPLTAEVTGRLNFLVAHDAVHRASLVLEAMRPQADLARTTSALLALAEQLDIQGGRSEVCKIGSTTVYYISHMSDGYWLDGQGRVYALLGLVLNAGEGIYVLACNQGGDWSPCQTDDKDRILGAVSDSGTPTIHELLGRAPFIDQVMEAATPIIEKRRDNKGEQD